ncbi:MAG: hypothetical protein KDD77_21030, partial [Caldilineaceae bacterium]|nr:hypothetical protein [Caldilineaceae bacterium]
MRKFKLVFIAAGLWASCQASALAQSATDAVVGDCRSFKFYPYFGDKLSDRQGQTVFVLRDKAPAYADAGSTT